jgi:hypothetical protein
MLVSFHKGFIMEGEASFKERKHFWSKPELVRRKIYSTTGVYGICDDSELDTVVEDKIQRRLKSSGWGTDFSGWQKVLTYEESVEVAERNNWSKDYVDFHLPSCELTTRTLEDWTVKKAASELNGKQFAQYCKDYGIVLTERDI